jgi:SAM-dependent methyltransferase
MPSVKENKEVWNDTYAWDEQGDEWSARWGGASMQWYGSLLPRIHRFVPAEMILEIACGYGRWTQYLKELCDRMIAVDLSERCIETSRQRFAGAHHIDFHVNDGRSLDMVPDGSVDFIFSFDSLVHADASVMTAYLSQFSRILAEHGVAFIHHSNLGEYRTFTTLRRIPKVRGIVRRIGRWRDASMHWRDPSVTARKVEQYAHEHQLQCISQELIPWGESHMLMDCISVIVKKGSRLARRNRKLKNPAFRYEKESLARLAHLYAPAGTTPAR